MKPAGDLQALHERLEDREAVSSVCVCVCVRACVCVLQLPGMHPFMAMDSVNKHCCFLFRTLLFAHSFSCAIHCLVTRLSCDNHMTTLSLCNIKELEEAQQQAEEASARAVSV